MPIAGRFVKFRWGLEDRAVVASFAAGQITSDAGALLLGAADRVIGLTRRLAACFEEGRDAAYTEHAVGTLAMQRAPASLGSRKTRLHSQSYLAIVVLVLP